MHPRIFSPEVLSCHIPGRPLSTLMGTSSSASQGSKAGRNLHQQGCRQGSFEGLPGHVQQENQGLPLPLHKQREHVHLIPLRVPGLTSLAVSTAPACLLVLIHELTAQPCLAPLFI